MILAGALALPFIRNEILRIEVVKGSIGLMKISQACHSLSSGDNPRRINAATIHDYAVAIAQYGDLNDPEPWLIKSDERVEEKLASGIKFPSVVADKPNKEGDKWSVNPDFKAWPISLAVANNTPPNAKETAPIAWTRGLKTDGTWHSEHSVFGHKYGIILFKSGQVRTFKGDELAENGGALINYKTGQPTKNILEAIHPEANVLETK